VAASPDLAQRPSAHRPSEEKIAAIRAGVALACVRHLASVSGQQAVNALGARPTSGTLASLAA
jgi:hypothetical protein